MYTATCQPGRQWMCVESQGQLRAASGRWWWWDGEGFWLSGSWWISPLCDVGGRSWLIGGPAVKAVH